MPEAIYNQTQVQRSPLVYVIINQSLVISKNSFFLHFVNFSKQHLLSQKQLKSNYNVLKNSYYCEATCINPMKDVSFLQHKKQRRFLFTNYKCYYYCEATCINPIKSCRYYNQNSISRPEGDRTRPFLSSTFNLFGSI